MGLLIIDTSGSQGWVIYAENEIPIIAYCNEDSNKHLEWLHKTIELTLKTVNKKEIEAIAVTNGPGSYTGVRIGLAAANGLAFSLNLPLITLNVLDIYYQKFKNEPKIESICPMIDARRNEVFTALYALNGEKILPQTALILKKEQLFQIVMEKKPLFCGNGAIKIIDILNKDFININSVTYNKQDITKLTYVHYVNKMFTNNFSLQVNYGKGFNELGQENWTENESKHD